MTELGHIIETPDCIAKGMRVLAQACPHMKHAIALVPDVPLRRRADGFAALADAIIGQQISVAAAASIRDKLVKADMLNPRNILSQSQEELRSFGLSRPKAGYLQALADADIDYIALRTAPLDQVVKELTAIKGIGVWTAQIYAMFSLGRADAFAAGDLALQEAARLLMRLPDRPNERELRTYAEAWRPWRGVAARVLWRYYHLEKKREGIMP